MFLVTMDIESILTRVAESLDISPTDYDRAVRSYKAVGKWLESGFIHEVYKGSTQPPHIYPQGSINLGTVVRPLKNGKESDFDIDLVCELCASRMRMEPGVVKAQVGDRLNDSDVYRDKLDEEGKRCWTLTYAESQGIGFHMDILPSVPSPCESDPDYPGAISITNKDMQTAEYVWKESNPKGFGAWFREKDTTYELFAHPQKQRLFEESTKVLELNNSSETYCFLSSLVIFFIHDKQRDSG